MVSFSHASSRFTPAYAGTIRYHAIRHLQCQVHPRVCGDDPQSFEATQKCQGSPPHVRGRWKKKICCMGSQRFTPACTGTIFSLLLKIVNEKGHPRVCGDDLPSVSLRRRCTGSPPRMRGRCEVISIFLSSNRVHPRMCGDDFPTKIRFSFNQGSPPRMRGRLIATFYGHVPVGVTPAYAGTMATPVFSFFEAKGHPRVCGDNLLRTSYQHYITGSPPRMRGRLLRRT